MRSPRTAVGALVFVLVATLAWAGAADARPTGGGNATITGSFSDSCRDFTAHATKVYLPRDRDISFVEVHYADGRVVKHGAVGSPDYSLDGAPGDEIDFAIVKSGTTRKQFDCVPGSSAPTARLQIKTPPVDQTLAHCYDFFSGGVACEQSAARTDWTSTTQIPDDGGSESGFFHWGCGALSHPSLCSFTISFRGTTSSDPDNDIASWSIDFGDGTSAGGSWSTPPLEVAHGYSGFGCGVCSLTLTITDSAGNSDSETMVMAFVDQSPD